MYLILPEASFSEIVRQSSSRDKEVMKGQKIRQCVYVGLCG